MSKGITLLLWCILHLTAFAQTDNPIFETLLPEQGLSFRRVPAIVQDKDGFMWFGTMDGLNRYDGYSFKEFKHDDKNPRSLSSSMIWALLVDKSGTLWIGTERGLNKYDPTTESFTRYPIEFKSTAEAADGFLVKSLYEDRIGNLWVGSNRGLKRFDRETGTYHDPQFLNEANVGFIGSICEDVTADARDGITLWLGTGTIGEGDGLLRFHSNADSFIHYRHDPRDPNSLSHDCVTKVYVDRSGNVWAGTYAGLDRLDRETQRFIHYRFDPKDQSTLRSNLMTDIFEDRAGVLWIGTYGGGLSKYDGRTRRFTTYLPRSQNRQSLSSSLVWCIYEDRTGALWIGTDWGVSIHDSQLNRFTLYGRNGNKNVELLDNNISAIYEDPAGTLWLGSGLGLNKLKIYEDGTTGPVTQYSNLTSIAERESQGVGAICPDHSGKGNMLWITTYGGLKLFDPSTGSFSQLWPEKETDVRATSILQDGNNAFWLGTVGLTHVDTKTGAVKRYFSDKQNPRSVFGGSSGPLCWFVVQDSLTGKPDSVLLVGMASGLCRFDRKTESFERYTHDPKNSQSLSNNWITALCCSQYDTLPGGKKRSTLWIGTADGLNEYQEGTGTFRHFGVREGLASAYIRSILEDRKGNLWISTNEGLSRLNPATRQVKNYGAATGLQIADSYEESRFVNARGELYFGGPYGFVRFHPDSIRENPYIPPIVITAFDKYDTTFALDTAIVQKKHIRLLYSDRVFSMTFAALNYAHPENNQYAYKLEGFDKDWAYCGTRRFVTYTNLDPGEYVFNVKGSNNDGIWNETGTSIAITITPPWWKTMWAYLGYLMVSISALYGIQRFRMNRLRLDHQLELEHLEAEKFKEVDRIKSGFFANISHEFRTPLTLVLGPLENLLSETKDERVKERLGVMKRNAQKLLGFINQLLDLSKLEVGAMKVRARRLNIVAAVRGIAYSFESSAGVRNIELSVTAREEEIEAYVDPEMLEKILGNLISNAFKFTPEGGSVTCTVGRHSSSSFEGASNAVQIRVADTGIGIPSEELSRIFDRFYQVDSSHTRMHEGSGIGLALVKELVELHHGTVDVKSEVGKGTEFTVHLPLGKEHLTNDEIVSGYLDTTECGIESMSMASPTLPIVIPKSRIDEPKATVPASASSPVILIVEDNADVRRYIADNLPPFYRTIEAVDGAEGIAKALESIPDLIVSDVMMPKKDGYEVCRTLKTDPKTSHIPIILLTARAATENKIEGLETGADDYLIKPFEPKELATRVKNLIDLRRKLREKFSVSVPLKPGEIAVSSMDDVFLRKVIAVVEQHIGDESFSVEQLGHEVAMSRAQIHRKLTALTNLSASEFIRYMRLHRAMEMLRNNSGTVSEIAYSVGFSDRSYFSRCFHGQFGMSPSEVRQLHEGTANAGSF